MDRTDIQSSAAKPWFFCRIQRRAHTMVMEKAESTAQMVTMVLHSEMASTSAVALSTQTMAGKQTIRTRSDRSVGTVLFVGCGGWRRRRDGSAIDSIQWGGRSGDPRGEGGGGGEGGLDWGNDRGQAQRLGHGGGERENKK